MPPLISIITPSFNQVEFLERTILSVLNQDYQNIEYIIIDGGSTDGSVDLIKRYESRLTYWVSEKDQGQSHAINKGLRRAKGEWVAWQNSDDIYYPGTFSNLAAAASHNHSAQLLVGNINLIDRHDRVIRDLKYVRPTYAGMLAEGMILANQSAFWRRCIHQQVGYLNEGLNCAFDYDWFLRLLSEGICSVHVNKAWGALRIHGATKTSNRQSTFDNEFDLILSGRKPPSWNRRYHQLRRMCSMLARGDVRYVLRGLISRMSR